MKRLMTTFLMTLSAFALAGCGGTSSNTPSVGGSNSSGTSDATVAYQFVGSYYEVASQFASFDFLANLNSDNTGTLYRLTCHADETQNTLEESDVTWKVEEDRDGIKTMTFTEKETGTIEAYETDGKFTLALKFTFAGSYSRTIDFVGSSTIQYETVEAWREDVEGAAFENQGQGPSGGETEDKETAYAFKASEVIIDSSSTVIANCAAECLLYEDGTAMARNGYAMGGTIYADYTKEEGTWEENDDGSLSITLKETDYTATENEDGLLSFTWKTTNEEGPVHAVFVQEK